MSFSGTIQNVLFFVLICNNFEIASPKKGVEPKSGKNDRAERSASRPIHERYTESEVSALEYYVADMENERHLDPEYGPKRTKLALDDLREMHDFESDPLLHTVLLDFTDDDDSILTTVDDVAAVMMFARHNRFTSREISLLNSMLQGLKDQFLGRRGLLFEGDVEEMKTSLMRVHGSERTPHDVVLDFEALYDLPPTFIGRTLRAALGMFELPEVKAPADKQAKDEFSGILARLSHVWSDDFKMYAEKKLTEGLEMIGRHQFLIEKDLENLKAVALLIESEVRQFHHLVDRGSEFKPSIDEMNNVSSKVNSYKGKADTLKRDIQVKLERVEKFLHSFVAKELVEGFSSVSGEEYKRPVPVTASEKLTAFSEDDLYDALEKKMMYLMRDGENP